MKLSNARKQQGSVLITTFLTMTILTMICATSLYVSSQNQNSGSQTSSWQQALSGAEAGIDLGVRALNTGAWSTSAPSGSPGQWYYALKPSPFKAIKPAGTGLGAASGVPTGSNYNYYVFDPNYPGAISMNGVSSSTSSPEGNRPISGWVTIDRASLSADTNGQWYRIRSTGLAGINGFRASNNRLDNDLRHTIGLRFDRKTNQALSAAQATRTIEVIMQPLTNSLWSRAITLRNDITMSGGGTIDSFDSSSPFKSTGGLYDPAKRQSNGSIATLNSGSNSDLKSTYVYGGLTYSGSPVKNTTNVQGTIATPFSATITDTSNPTWNSGTYTAYSSGSPPFATITTGSKANPKLIKVNGDFTVPGGQTLAINADPANTGTDNNYITIWVTGKLTTSGSGVINQAANAKVTWIVDDDITVSGSSFNNMGGVASNLMIIGVGTGNKVTVSGGGSFIGTLNAPGFDVTISGSGGLSGAVIANSLNISGGAGLHYDQALSSGGASTIGNYAFASWFEDNSDPTRKDVNNNYIIY